MAKRGTCTNFGNCTKADGKTIVEIAVGQDFSCPECKRPLLPAAQPNGEGARRTILAALALILVGGGIAGWYFVGGTPQAPTPAPDPTPPVRQSPSSPPAPPQPPMADNVILRLSGSNTIGKELAPALAEAYFRKVELAPSVRRESLGKPEEVVVKATDAAGVVRAIVIRAHGSSTAFQDLAAGQADIGMASRRIKKEEAQKLSGLGLGDMTSPANEHVLALDGVAVVVHRNNPINQLSIDQIANIFSGAITDWSQVGGPSRVIAIHARDDKSGTYDTFRELVLQKRTLSDQAKRYEDSHKLSDAVAGDPNAIGFIGIPYIGNTKALAVSSPGAQALPPSPATIRTEGYPLSRRLFLYTSEAPTNWTSSFVRFALSKEGQQTVADTKFINLILDEIPQRPSKDAPKEYTRPLEGASRIATDFRFRTNSYELDNKALPDVDRLIEYLNANPERARRGVILMGFADSIGGDPVNCPLSKNRAQAVADVLKTHQVRLALVEGLCSRMPVADNATEEGREKNRRVEVWLR